MSSLDEKLSLPTGPETTGPHPGGDVRFGGFLRFTRICAFIAWFLVCVLVILGTQIIGAPLYFVNKPLYYAWMARTKQHFGVVITTLTQWGSPTVIRVTGDRTVRDQIKRSENGSLECKFPERMVLIANHQLYADWLYLWWIAYTARMHGYIYIILKESLKYIPLLGLGMQFFSFVFLARKWEQDKSRIQHRLSKLCKREDPMWLLIFPEGTNASANTRKTSERYAAKLGIEDLKHELLPRSTGLRFILEQMEGTMDWVYDCTVAYGGVRRGEYGQDFFTLYSVYIEGRPPKSVNMYWRRFAVKDIPISDPEKFELWLRERWIEKDVLLEYYVANGAFPEDDVPKEDGAIDEKPSGLRKRVTVGGKERIVTTSGGTDRDGKWGGPVETEVKIAGWGDVLSIFSALGAVLLFINIVFKIAALAKLWASAQ